MRQIKHRKEISTWRIRKKEVKDFVINYTDGSSVTVDKGFFCNIQEEPDGVSNLKFELVGCSGKRPGDHYFGCVNLGAKMGLFDKEREEISE